jgi:pyruvate/2-oxoglutarate dehydrogenase complex dihydrolipoamide acyltransferase (E2) component
LHLKDGKCSHHFYRNERKRKWVVRIISVYPIYFGTGKIIRKPAVINDTIEIREMLTMTILLNHDVNEEIPMAQFISNLLDNIEKRIEL